MSKKFITFFIIFLISFAFTTNSFAIILENLPTNTHSVQPALPNITSNMSNNFDIDVYNSIRKDQNFQGTAPSMSNVSVNNPQTNGIQNNLNVKKSGTNFWYWLVTFVILVVAILYWILEKLKNYLSS